MKIPLPQLKTVMTPFPYSIEVDASLEDARALLSEHDFHHLPVTAAGKLVGMLSSTMLTHALAQRAGAPAKVREHYDPHACIVAIDEPLREVLARMSEQHLDAVIVTRHGRLAGVFTTVDACGAFSELLLAHEPQPDGDAVA